MPKSPAVALAAAAPPSPTKDVAPARKQVRDSFSSLAQLL